ncbi:MAG TPA: VOC family protein [Chloroflexota bacterium]|nr:VOC family protein [Chloroflexota bacterium]
MPFHLDHTIVPARDKEGSARWFAKMFGLEYKGPWGHFAPVKVDDNLSMDFDDAGEDLPCLHFAFITTDSEFDRVLQRVKDEGIPFGSGPRDLEDYEINHKHQGRGVYFRDPNGHILEVITHTYV